MENQELPDVDAPMLDGFDWTQYVTPEQREAYRRQRDDDLKRLSDKLNAQEYGYVPENPTWADVVLSRNDPMVYGPGFDLDGKYHEGAPFYVDALREKLSRTHGQEFADIVYPKREKPKLLRDMLLNTEQVKELPPLEWLLSEILPRDSVVMMGATGGVGKSFLAHDWANHIAHGRERWHGRSLKQGKVLYIAAEGQSGYRDRQIAWERAHGAAENSSHLMVLPVATNLNDPGIFRQLMEIVKEHRFDLIVIDTWARSTSGSDENGNSDASVGYDKLDQLRRIGGACVLVVHHTGKDETKGLRGASALRDNANTVIIVGGKFDDPNNVPMWLSTESTVGGKQKDARELRVEFVRREVELNEFDDDGNMRTSCAIFEMDDEAKLALEKPEDPNAWFEGTPRKMAEALQQLGATSPKTAVARKQWEEAAKVSRNTFDSHKSRLLRERIVRYQDDDKRASNAKYWIPAGEIKLGTVTYVDPRAEE